MPVSSACQFLELRPDLERIGPIYSKAWAAALKALNYRVVVVRAENPDSGLDDLAALLGLW